MKKIASFSVDHNKIDKGMYISRVDGDIISYDIRMKKPNAGEYLSASTMHTIEHIFATYARNSEVQDSVIYVGPMGCRTGFYLLVRDTISHEQAIALVQNAMQALADFEGEIPGNKQEECGNYLDHDLPSAKEEGRAMAEVLKSWTVSDLQYK